MKPKRKNKQAPKNNLLLSRWKEDRYTLGLFCGKAGLVDYAKRTSALIRGNGDESRLFTAGVRDSGSSSYEDYANEIAVLRQGMEKRFDDFIAIKCGSAVLQEIKQSLKVNGYL